MQRAIKTLVEWLLALALLILLTPLLMILAASVAAADGRPVIYTEQRQGLRGKPFTLLKFRTLRVDDGPGIAPEGDPRIFPVARRMRRWRLDELPQLVNVLRGDMSLIGPRPLPPAHAATLSDATLSRLYSVRPGIAGTAALAFVGDDAALSGRHDAEARYLTDVLPAKVALDIDYLEHWGLAADAAIAWQTLTRLWSPRARKDSRDRVARLLANGDARPDSDRY